MRLNRSIWMLLKLLSLWCALILVPITYFHFFRADRQVYPRHNDVKLSRDLGGDLKPVEQQPSVPQNISSSAVRTAGVASVVVLTYQRCGSSFYGNMFNTNPSAFYMFEPLDSLYSSLYGTKHGYNVPSDIYSYANGTQRLVPDVELEAVSRFITDLFTCNIARLPTDTLYHTFWAQMEPYFTSTNNYVRCLKTRTGYSKPRICDEFNPWLCGRRFGEKPEESRLDNCRQVLTGASRRRPVGDTDNAPIRDEADGLELIRKQYEKYEQCLATIREQIDSMCAPILNKICTISRLRSTKITRASMRSMEPLLIADPQFRVIHLIRDPRAVIASRLAAGDESLVGLYSLHTKPKAPPYETSAVHEAALFCKRAVKNLRIATTLAVRYPGRIMTVRYEDVVKDFEGHVEVVYRFLGFERVPSATLDWLRRDQAEKRNATLVEKRKIEKWKTQLSVGQNEAISDVCSEFFSLVSDVTR